MSKDQFDMLMSFVIGTSMFVGGASMAFAAMFQDEPGCLSWLAGCLMAGVGALFALAGAALMVMDATS